MSPSASNQYAANYDTARYEMPWQVNISAARKKVLEMPVLIWDDKYRTKPGLLVDLCRRVSDAMMINPHLMYADNPNQAYLHDIVKGIIRTADYEAMTKLFGDEGAMPIKDNNFFHKTKETLNSRIINQPNQIGVQQISSVWAEKQILDDSKRGAKIAVQGLLESFMQAGEMGVAPLRDQSVDIPRTKEDWIRFQTGQQQIEDTMHSLLEFIDSKNSFQDLALKALDNKYADNGEFAFINVKNGHVVPEPLDSRQVRILAGKRVETVEDDAVIGVQVNRYMTPTELLTQLGTGRLNYGTGVKGVVAYLNKLFDGKADTVGYDPFMQYWNEMGIITDSWFYEDSNDPKKPYTRQQINWMQGLFYPSMSRTMGLLTNILVQNNYFKMFREKRFMVEKITSTGDRMPATDREIDRYRDERYTCDYDIDFTPLATGDAPKNAKIRTYQRPEIWEFTRIGHSCFIDIGPYKYQPGLGEEESEDDKPHFPVVGQISYEKSMAKLLENDAVRTNVLQMKIDKALASLGYETALVIDDVHGLDPVSYIYNAKESGVIKINSTRYPSGSQAALLHLKEVKLSNLTEQIQIWFNQLRMIEEGANARIGASSQVQGVSQPYDGLRETQINIANQQQLNSRYGYEHNLFMKQVYQRTADIAKFHYAKDNEVRYILATGQQKILKLTSKLRMARFGLAYGNTQEMAKRLELQDAHIQMLMQSGGIDKAGILFEIAGDRNPSRRAARLKEYDDEVQARQAEIDQANQAHQQRMAELELQKQQIPLQIQQNELEFKRWQEQFRAGEKRNQEDFKGEMADIKTANDREQKAIDTENQAAMQQQNQNAQMQQEQMRQQNSTGSSKSNK